MKLITTVKRIRLLNKRVSEINNEIDEAQEELDSLPCDDSNMSLHIKNLISEKLKDVTCLERELDDLWEPIRIDIAYVIMIIIIVAILFKH